MDSFTLNGKNYEMNQHSCTDIVTKILPNIFGPTICSVLKYGELKYIQYMLNTGWTLIPSFETFEEDMAIYPNYNKFSKWCTDGTDKPTLYICVFDYLDNKASLYANGFFVAEFYSIETFQNHMNNLFEQPPIKCTKYYDKDIYNNVRKFDEIGFGDIYKTDYGVYHKGMDTYENFTYEVDTDKCHEFFLVEGE